MNQVEKEILESIISIDKENETTINAKVKFSEDFIGFNGHFIEQPVLPVICILELIKCILQKYLKHKLMITEIVSAKFFNIIAGKETVDVAITMEENKGLEILVKASINRSYMKKTLMKLRLKRL